MKYAVQIGSGDWFRHSKVNRGDTRTYRYTESIAIS
jgi:hypothetical protein